MKKTLLTSLALTLFVVAGAQTTHFSQTIGQSSGTTGMGSIRLATGSFITVTTNGGGQLEMQRYSNNGTVQSAHKLGHSSYYFSSVSSVTPAGNNAILVTGESGFGSGSMFFFVAKIDLTTYTMTIAGKPVDAFTYTKGPRAFYSPEGSVYALFPQYGYFDVHKLNDDLTTSWTKSIECDTLTGKNPGMDCELIDSSIIVVGKCDSVPGWCDLDTNGSVDTFKLLMIDGYTRIYSITKMYDGTLLLAGLHSPVYASGPDSRPLIAKVSRNGSVIWARVLDQGATRTFARFVDAQALPDGRIVGFASVDEAYSDTYFDGACVFDANGNLQSATKFGTATGLYRLYDVKIYNSGILMSGNVSNIDDWTTDRVMIFTDATFKNVCDKSPVTVNSTNFNMGGVNNVGTAGVREHTGLPTNHVIAGTMASGGTVSPVVCSMTTGLEEEVMIESNVYPNPVISGGQVFVEMETASTYDFVITDLSGKVVSRQNVTGNRATISTQDMATGAYVLNVVNNQQTVAVHKLMVK